MAAHGRAWPVRAPKHLPNKTSGLLTALGPAGQPSVCHRETEPPMSEPKTEEFDVVVVGGGPAGATTATLVAKQGHRVLLLEKETFPRYQIGESLLPSTVHGVCRLLGVTEQLRDAGFTLKRGGTFKWGASPKPWTFRFSVSSRLGGSTSYAYQVERMKFDQILLDNARRNGVEVRERCSVVDVVSADGRIRGLRYIDEVGRRGEASAQFVVDASGNRSSLHKQVGERNYSEFFQNIALFGYFEGGKRLPAPNSGNIFSIAFDHGWFWYIPLTPQLTSVGAVVERSRAAEVQGDPEQALRRFVENCPEIRDFLADARPVTSGPYGRLRVRKDYSYCNTGFWRPGMLLVGDAACFVDPVFSSGVHLATYSGLLAARSINSTLEGNIDEHTAFEEFELRYRREYRLFYEFLLAFYDMHVSEESYFWQAKKVTQCRKSELESFVELVGGVASGESVLSTPEALSVRFSAASNELAKVVSQAQGGHVFGAGVVDSAMHEGARVQRQAVLGDAAGREEPVRPGGLIPSDDGMRWVRGASG
jgi:halogenation protein CepH